jgi:hypothetical protein
MSLTARFVYNPAFLAVEQQPRLPMAIAGSVAVCLFDNTVETLLP